MTPEEAIRKSVDSAGGMKAIGHALRPELEPATADEWLVHCLTASRREKLSLAQLVYIFRQANQIAGHAGFNAFCRLCGYGTAEPLLPEAQLAEASKRALAAKHEAEAAVHDLQTLIDNPRLLATMRAAGLKVDA